MKILGDIAFVLGSGSFLILFGFWLASAIRVRGQSPFWIMGTPLLASLAILGSQYIVSQNLNTLLIGAIFTAYIYGFILLGILLQARAGKQKPLFGLNITRKNNVVQDILHPETVAHIRNGFARMSKEEQRQAVVDLEEITGKRK